MKFLKGFVLSVGSISMVMTLGACGVKQHSTTPNSVSKHQVHSTTNKNSGKVAQVQPTNVQKVFMTSDNTGWALGKHQLYLLQNNKWKDVTPTNIKNLNDIYSLNGVTWVVSGSQLYTTQNNGLKWTKQTLPVKVKYPNNSIIRFLNKTDGWIIVHGSESMGIHPFDILHTTDGGKTWKIVTHVGSDSNKTTIPISDFADNLSFSSPTDGWLVGETNNNMQMTFFHSENAGQSWNKSSLKAPKGYEGYATQPQNPQFSSSNSGKLAVTFEGNPASKQSFKTVIYNFNGRGSWNAVSTLNAGADVTFLNQNIGWAIENSSPTSLNKYIVWKTTDGGKTWKKIQTISQQLYDVQFTSEKTAWAIGRENKQLYTSNDGGATWKEVK